MARERVDLTCYIGHSIGRPKQRSFLEMDINILLKEYLYYYNFGVEAKPFLGAHYRPNIITED